MNTELIKQIDAELRIDNWDNVHHVLDECKAEIERLESELSKAREYDEAKELATYLWRNHYAGISPDWSALPDLSGVLSQISNMVTGMTLAEYVLMEKQERYGIYLQWQYDQEVSPQTYDTLLVVAEQTFIQRAKLIVKEKE